MTVQEIRHNGRPALMRVELNDFALFPPNYERFDVPGLGLMAVVDLDAGAPWLPSWQALDEADQVHVVDLPVHPTFAQLSHSA